MTDKEILIKVKELLSDPNKWCKNYYAHNSSGEMTTQFSDAACSFCILGATSRVCNDVRESVKYMTIICKLRACLSDEVVSLSIWNDSIATHEDILKLLDKAIEAEK